MRLLFHLLLSLVNLRRLKNMKFLVVLCLLALAAADDDNQDKKVQGGDLTSNSGLTPTSGSLLNSQVFPPSPFASGVPYTGFDGNIGSIQPVNPNFFNAGTVGVPTVVNTPIQGFPVTRTVFQTPTPVVNGAQGGFPVTGGVFPSVVSGLQSQFPVTGGVIPQVTGLPVAGGIYDAATAGANGAISGAPAAYRFLNPEGITGIPTQGLTNLAAQGLTGLATQTLAGIPTQGLQTPQAVGLAGIPAFTSGILPAIGSAVLQGQGLPTGVLKNPTGGASQNIPNVSGLTTGNISSASLARAFGQA